MRRFIDWDGILVGTVFVIVGLWFVLMVAYIVAQVVAL